MDTRDGTIYDDRESAIRAGVPDEDLVTGSRAALEKLRNKLVFTKGSFKSTPCPCGLGGEQWHMRGWCDIGKSKTVD